MRELGRNREAGRITYLVTALNTNQQAIIKEFRFAIAGADWSAFKAYQREIEVLQQLNHPRIPRYLGSFEMPSGFCLVQEYKNAPSLAERFNMTVSQVHAYFSSEEYLEIEQISPIKHEYRQGLIYAMAGASKAHVIITANTSRQLGNYLQDSNCIVYATDTKVRIEVADVFYYPDVTVTCEEQDRNSDEDFIRYPCLIIEVLSPKTEAFDRGDKFNDYKTLEALQEYVLIDQKKMSVECFRRNEEGNWVSYTYGAGEDVRLTSIDFSCPIAALYEKVSLLV